MNYRTVLQSMSRPRQPKNALLTDAYFSPLCARAGAANANVRPHG
jgi:hypothetical protein